METHSMYCEFFGLSEKPFTITPNPKFAYFSRQHRDAFAHLLYGIDSHAGFIALTGEVGLGKTTLLRSLLSQLDPEKYSTALIFNPCLSAEQLLASICEDYGLAPDPADGVFGFLTALNRFLIEENGKGRTVVLVIDESQNLTWEVLEQIRLISNLESESDKLIQMVLAGQPELDDLLSKHELRQLNQRITVRFHLGSMNLDDTRDYIRHRLKVAGNRTQCIFTDGAIRRIHRYSAGIPRMINAICERSLVVAWTQESGTVTPEIAREVISAQKASTRMSIGNLIRRFFK